MYVNGNNTVDLDSFGVERILKEIKKIIGNKNIITNIYRIEANDSIYWLYVKRQKFFRLYIFILSNEYEINDKIILKYFQ